MSARTSVAIPDERMATCVVGESVLDVARRQGPVRPESTARTLETNGFGVSRTFDAEYSTAPSAVFHIGRPISGLLALPRS